MPSGLNIWKILWHKSSSFNTNCFNHAHLHRHITYLFCRQSIWRLAMTLNCQSVETTPRCRVDRREIGCWSWTWSSWSCHCIDVHIRLVVPHLQQILVWSRQRLLDHSVPKPSENVAALRLCKKDMDCQTSLLARKAKGIDIGLTNVVGLKDSFKLGVSLFPFHNCTQLFYYQSS